MTDKDPWANLFGAPLNERVETDIPVMLGRISPLDQMRLEMGEPIDEAKIIDDHSKIVPLLEQYGDDSEFQVAIKNAVTLGLKGHEPKLLYNPGCGTHVGLAQAFPHARTIFSDTDGDVEHAFDQHNIDKPSQAFRDFYRADMHRFKLPDELRADVTLILNAGYMTEEELDQVVSKDGIVVVNDWHNAATYMRENCPGYDEVTALVAETTDLTTPENKLYIFCRKTAFSI